MKKIVFTIALLVMCSASHALVADKFKCQIELKDTVSHTSAKIDKDFFIARLPLSASPSPDVRLTAGGAIESLALSTPKAKLSANLNFYYKHAVRLDEHGTTLEARQLTCVALTGSYCEKSDDGGLTLCGGGLARCFESLNPFDPIKGWSPTALIDGMPKFNEQTFGPATTPIQDKNGNQVGSVNFQCQLLGSFQ